MITEGKMQYLYDEKGRRYLDVSNSMVGPVTAGLRRLNSSSMLVLASRQRAPS